MEDINEMIAGGNLVVALALLTEKLTKEPENVEALKLRGELLLRMGDKQGAQEDARRLMEIAPDMAAEISGDFTAKGVEQRPKRRISNLNPLGI
ncbi:MAG: hypothetical protein MR924_06215 [Prevotella sp.]|nr:hypothetical protein [Prevotella sp.]